LIPSVMLKLQTLHAAFDTLALRGRLVGGNWGGV
jgi:hypothetical protein